MAQSVALPQPTTASQVLVQAGVTQLPGDSVGGVQSTVPSVTALEGWDIQESTGAATAKARIWDGTSSGGSNILLAEIDLVANGRDAPPIQPLQVRNNALYLQVVSGSIEGEVIWG